MGLSFCPHSTPHAAPCSILIMCQLKTGIVNAPTLPVTPKVAPKPTFTPTLAKRPQVPAGAPASPAKKICLNAGALEVISSPSASKVSCETTPDVEQKPDPAEAALAVEGEENAPVEVEETEEDRQRALQANTLALIEASRAGQLAEIKRLVEEVEVDVNESYLGYSALHYAVFYNHRAVVEYLIECEANVDAKNQAGITPLAWAVDRNHVDLVGFLLESEADPSIANNEGITPLHKAARDGNHKMVETLLSINTEEEEWTPVNARTALGYTAAYFAAFNGNVDVLKLLFEYGADFDLCSKANVVPLHRAVNKKHDLVVRFLLQCNINVNKKDDNGRTALHTAAFTNQPEIVEELLKHGATCMPDTAGRTPLDLAALRKNREVIAILEALDEE